MRGCRAHGQKDPDVGCGSFYDGSSDFELEDDDVQKLHDRDIEIQRKADITIT